MAETDTHRDLMVDLIQALQSRYQDRDDVYVSGNILLYYEKGNKRRHVSPDVLVVFGIPKEKRDYYLLWREGRAPDVVIEITSSSTRHEDMHKKRRLYAEIGVREYFLFDPRRDYLKPQMRGYRLVQGQWAALVGDPIHSEALDLDLRVIDGTLRLVDPHTGKQLPTPVEEARKAAEDARNADEKTHKAVEEACRATEQARNATEQARNASEQARNASEEARRANEEARKAAEEACKANEDAAIARAEAAADRAARLEAERELARVRKALQKD